MSLIRLVIVLLLFAALMLTATGAFAQKVEIDLSDVPRDYRSMVVDVANKNKERQGPPAISPENASKWIGVGREVGEAVNASLGAVVTSAEQFGKTSVGRFTMFLVAWRLFGDDILGYVIKIPIMLLGIGIVVYSYRRQCITYKVLVKHDKAAKLKEWKTVEPHSWDVRAVYAFVHGVIFIVVFLVGFLNL